MIPFITTITAPNFIYFCMAGWFCFCFFLIYKKWQKKPVNDYIYDSIPSMFVTLGVLGTFGGIYIGLQDFQVDTMENIEKSIPSLLEGLRGAFSTSIIGMLLSLVTGRVADAVQGIQDTDTLIPSDELNAIKQVGNSMSHVVRELQKLNLSFDKDEATSIPQQLSLITDSSNQRKTVLDTLVQETQQASKKQLVELKAIKENQTITIDAISLFQENVTKQSKQELTIVETIKDEIISNRSFLDGKFNEFAKLLAENNTKALVEVMKEATEQFNNQMRALIDKLVKENFQELNNSVQQLNSWQKKNKEQVTLLINTFDKVTQNFESSSSSISTITTNTEKLTASNSHLSKLIQELQKVMIDDTKFQEITNQLTSTVDTVKGNIEAFDATTNQLNTWVKKQMKFSDSVNKLLVRLEDIDKIKDVNEIFWKETKKQLTKGVEIISKASTQLGTDIDSINETFYERLNNTLQNLDTLIIRIIEKNSKAQR